MTIRDFRIGLTGFIIASAIFGAVYSVNWTVHYMPALRTCAGNLDTLRLVDAVETKAVLQVLKK